MENENSFNWSLKLLTWITRFSVGTSIDFTNNKRRCIRFSVFCIGCFILLANILINGPRGINIAKFKWMEKIQHFESPFGYFKENPDDLLQFVIDIATIALFVAVSLIQIIFLVATYLSHNWILLASNLLIIKKEMNTSLEFQRNCRNRCIISFGLAALV